MNSIINRSKRKYSIAVSSLTGIDTRSNLNLKDIEDLSTHDKYEWAHALMDRSDDLLDMPDGSCMYFNANRDDKSVKGMIVRTA